MRLTISLITHHSEQVAARCMETVVAQQSLGELLHANEGSTPSGGAMKRAREASSASWQVICLDNASQNRIELIRLEKKFPQVRFLREEKNCGFARGHNKIIRTFPADFHAVLNPDLLLAPDFLAKLLGALEGNPSYGSAVGKLLTWDIGGSPERTKIIDSVGIQVTKGHAFEDSGQGEEDRGQFEKSEERFGGSGAAVVYRRSALEEVAYHLSTACPSKLREAKGEVERSGVNSQLSNVSTEYFDETMFLYKEDIDLAYRLLVTGHPCLYVPDAIAWHARSLRTAHLRQGRSRQKRVWSAAHETLLLRKHRHFWPFSMRVRTACRQCLKWKYLLLLEPHVFFSARTLLRSLKGESEKRRSGTKHTVSFESIAHLFR